MEWLAYLLHIFMFMLCDGVVFLLAIKKALVSPYYVDELVDSNGMFARRVFSLYMLDAVQHYTCATTQQHSSPHSKDDVRGWVARKCYRLMKMCTVLARRFLEVYTDYVRLSGHFRTPHNLRHQQVGANNENRRKHGLDNMRAYARIMLTYAREQERVVFVLVCPETDVYAMRTTVLFEVGSSYHRVRA